MQGLTYIHRKRHIIQLQAMDIAVFFFILFFSAIFVSITSFEVDCTALNCSNTTSPLIHFPFWVSNDTNQPKNCSTNPSSFQLYCKNNTTMIHFPTYSRDLIVKSISYDDRKLQLADPNTCVHEVFLNLNLSLTPFSYYFVVKNYTYLNCSTLISSPSFVQIPCLSGSRHHIYTVEPLDQVPVSCREVKTVAIPFSFSPYLSDNCFGLVLTWSLPAGIEEHNQLGLSLKQWSLVVLCIFAVAIVLARIEIYHSEKVDKQSAKSNLLELLNYTKIQDRKQ